MLQLNKSYFIVKVKRLNLVSSLIFRKKETKTKGDKFVDVFLKLKNNAFYGKTVDNVYNRQDVELVNGVDRYL